MDKSFEIVSKPQHSICSGKSMIACDFQHEIVFRDEFEFKVYNLAHVTPVVHTHRQPLKVREMFFRAFHRKFGFQLVCIPGESHRVRVNILISRQTRRKHDRIWRFE